MEVSHRNVPSFLILPSRSGKGREQHILSVACQTLLSWGDPDTISAAPRVPGEPVDTSVSLDPLQYMPLYLGLFISLEFEEMK